MSTVYFPTDPELDAMYQQGLTTSHYAGLRVVYQAALSAAQAVVDPNAAANAILTTAPTQDTSDLSTATTPTN